jgi:NADPH-dependent 2,4-dienoyl-CoA reductase/sulfur reductase-like enzyme
LDEILEICRYSAYSCRKKKRFICVIASTVVGLLLADQLAAAPKQTVVVVHRPTIAITDFLRP